jgi:hypothetical protein
MRDVRIHLVDCSGFPGLTTPELLVNVALPALNA